MFLAQASDGKIVTPVGISAFNWANFWQFRRQDALDIAHHALDHGADHVRWFLFMNGGIGQRLPSAPDSWKWAREAAGALKDLGLGSECVVGADMQTPELAGFDLADLYERADLEFGELVDILDVVNEWNHPNVPAGFDPSRLLRSRSARLSSKGSGTIDALPWLPPWDIAMGHINRDRGAAHALHMVNDWRSGNTSEGISVPGPIGVDELLPFGETMQPGRTTNDPQRAWTYGAAARFWRVALITTLWRDSVLNNAALTTVLPGPKATACLEACVLGATQMPIPPGEGYSHGNAEDGYAFPLWHMDAIVNNPDGSVKATHSDGAERTYAKDLDGGRKLILVDEAGPDWTERVSPGWRREQAFGRPGARSLGFILAR